MIRRGLLARRVREIRTRKRQPRFRKRSPGKKGPDASQHLNPYARNSKNRHKKKTGGGRGRKGA